ncbi:MULTISPECIES: ABC transporter substrate-binding protein [Shouchella]|uniref:ABC transporter substrate-binding protein n=1 Tax=Shouchella hunanensis TaxID=766894 RepID=A0ABY7W9X5_9BACI|nr:MULTISPECIES: ABC transporter substrate-binding protein [Shouchella]WDF04286.1 ABC transporter substrate-binding protein [Shouchella hunanensis]
MKRLLAFLSVACSLAFVVGCQSDGPTETLEVAEVTRSVFYAPLYVALSEGFFEEEGLSIELTTTWGGDKTMTALLSGGADIALVGSETSIYVAGQEATDPAINFAALTQTDGTFLVARDQVDSFQWSELKGTTFLGQRKGGMPQMVGEFVLKQHDINPRTDLTLLQNVDFGNIPSAFASGTGDYVQLFEPQASTFEKEGLGHVVASFGAESGRVPYTSFMARQSMIEKDEEALIRFASAIYKGQQYVKNEDSSTIAMSIQDYFEDTELDILTSAVERYKDQGSYATDPLLTEEAWSTLLAIMDEAGELPLHIPFDELVNTAIASKSME